MDVSDIRNVTRTRMKYPGCLYVVLYELPSFATSMIIASITNIIIVENLREGSWQRVLISLFLFKIFSIKLGNMEEQNSRDGVEIILTKMFNRRIMRTWRKELFKNNLIVKKRMYSTLKDKRDVPLQGSP